MIFANAKYHARICLAACALLALASCGGGGGDAGLTTPTPGSSTTTLAGAQELVNTFAATLTGAEETPATASAAQGAGTIVVNPGTRVATATITTSGIVATAAQIQEGAPGAAGPIVFTLAETAPGSAIWSSKFTLTDAQLTALQGGNFYFNVRSAGFPNGEIRGQILSQQAVAANSTSGTFGTNATGSGLNAAATGPTAFIAALRGTQEIPPNPSTGQGSGAVLTDPARRSLLVAVTTSGIVGTAAHIQSGAPGTAGPIIVPLVETPAGSGVWIANATLSDDQYRVLTSGGLYLNVRSTSFPEGEIRGQILPVQQSVSALTGIGSSGAGTPVTTGTGFIGTGLTGTGITGTGITGTGLTGTGLTGTGLTDTGLTGTGLTGTGLTGTGLTGTGLTGTGLTGTGLTGTGLTGTGLTSPGLTGTGLTGTGTGLTGTGAFGTTGTTGTTIGPSMTGTSTIGTGLSGTGF
ncbi:CHRD domain-containing protein [Noviherbaspirillum autotrophicum]|uniref:CHRD domain-containing protein n=1 Tax=Noviherbaspirillum autotrophicum TaxID=709839 RepID=UPI000694F247|nr:CHRD domain-containing protein [Noviherbaspirillum autotrophicum]